MTVELALKKPLFESLAPNQDAVRDAVNPLKGLKDVGLAVEEAGKVLEKIRQETVYSDALSQYSSVSLSAHKRFYEYITKLDMSDTTKVGDEITAYVDGELRTHYDKWLGSIPDRAVRHGLRTHIEHDLLDFQKKGLQHQIGATVIVSQGKVDTFVSNVADKLKIDPSNENYERLSTLVDNMIYSLPVSPVKKQKLKNKAYDILDEAQISGTYEKDPHIFDQNLVVSYRPNAPIKDPTSLAERVDGAGKREVKVSDELRDVPLLGYKRMGYSKRRVLLERLAQSNNKVNAKKRTELNTEVKHIQALLDKGIDHKDVDKITIDRLTEVYGVGRGVELYELLQFKKENAPNIVRINVMPEAEATEFLKEIEAKALDPSNTPEFMNRYLYMHKTLSEAHKKSMDLLQTDTIKWGVKNGKIDPLRLDSIEGLATSLSKRSTFIKQTEKDLNIKGTHFNHDDALRGLRNQLMRSSPHEFVEMFQSVVEFVNEEDRDYVRRSFGTIKNTAVGAITTLIAQDHPEAKDAAIVIAKGAKGRKDIEAHYKALRGHNFEDVYGYRVNRKIAGIYSNGEHNPSFIQDKEAIKLYLLGSMQKSGNYELNDHTITQAVKAVLGNTPTPTNGCTLIPPRGMDTVDFVDNLHTATRIRLKELGKVGKEGLSEFYGYMNIGDGKYMLTQSRVPVRDDNGNGIIIDVKNVPKEKVDDYKKEKEKEKELERRVFNINDTLY